MDRFPYELHTPSIDGVTTTAKARVLAVQFGDGYEQTTPDGINTDISTYALSWNNIDGQEKDEVYNFLMARLSHKPFLFKLPDWNEERVVKCTTLTKTDHLNNRYSISADFKRDYSFT